MHGKASLRGRLFGSRGGRVKRSGSGLTALAVVGDRRVGRGALELFAAGRNRGPDLALRLLHAGAAVRQPVDIDEAVVLAAIALAGGNRRREGYAGVGGG